MFQLGDKVRIVRHHDDSDEAFKRGEETVIITNEMGEWNFNLKLRDEPELCYYLKINDPQFRDGRKGWWVADGCLELLDINLENE